MKEEIKTINISVSQIVDLLNQYLKEIPSLKEKQEKDESPEFIEWKSSVESIFRRTFGEDSYERKEFNSINYYPTFFVGGEDESELKEFYIKGLNNASAQIKSAISMLSTMGVPKSQPITKKSGTSISVNPSFYQASTMSQNQSTNLSLEQIFNQAIKTIEENYGKEQSKEAKDKLDSLKSNKNWGNVSEVVKFFVNMGKQAFIATIPIITKILLEN